MKWVIWKKWVPTIVSDVEIPSHNKNIANIDFSILDILSSHLR